MSVRVPIRIICGDKDLVTKALVNSRFESPEPDLAAPLNIADQLSL